MTCERIPTGGVHLRHLSRHLDDLVWVASPRVKLHLDRQRLIGLEDNIVLLVGLKAWRGYDRKRVGRRRQRRKDKRAIVAGCYHGLGVQCRSASRLPWQRRQPRRVRSVTVPTIDPYPCASDCVENTSRTSVRTQRTHILRRRKEINGVFICAESYAMRSLPVKWKLPGKLP